LPLDLRRVSDTHELFDYAKQHLLVVDDEDNDKEVKTKDTLRHSVSFCPVCNHHFA